MASGPDLQSVLETILGTDKVYFQPPESVKMVYPCIRYEWDSEYSVSADDTLYLYRKRYRVVVMDYSPNSPIPDKVRRLPFCKFDRHYTANNLHHFSFNLYY